MGLLVDIRDEFKELIESEIGPAPSVDGALMNQILQYADYIARNVGTQEAPTYTHIALLPRMAEALEQAAENLGQVVEPGAVSSISQVVSAFESVVLGLGKSVATPGTVSLWNRLQELAENVNSTDQIILVDDVGNFLVDDGGNILTAS